MKSLKLLPFFCSVGIFVMASCSESNSSKSSGYVSRTDDRWKNKSINVCFTQYDQVLDTAKSLIISGINQEYGKVGFRFNLLSACSQAPALRITFIHGAASMVNRIGSGVTEVRMGVNHPCTSAAGTNVNYLNSSCLRNVAVHEFGHALGLHHEMNRRDNDDRCEADQTNGLGESGAIQLGDYDNSSVMNYCNVFRMNNKNQLMTLSSGDLNTLRAIYEGPVASVNVMPSAVLYDLNQISFRVTGQDLTEFQLKFGLASLTDCKNSAGYSPFLPIAYTNTGAEMVQEFLGESPVVPGDYRICLIGRNAAKTQAYASYSSIDVTLR